jgi:hypothetical protein
MIRTHNSGHVAVGTELDFETTTAAERAAILEREARLKQWRKSLPRRRKPMHEKPGPVTWITMSR